MLTIRPAKLTYSAALLALAREFATSFSVERSIFKSSLAALLHSSDAFIALASNIAEPRTLIFNLYSL